MKKTKLLAVALLASLTFSNAASAAILFQDDTFHDIPSEAILIDSDGAGANSTSIQFGDDSTASENGTVTWDITNNEFQFDHTVDITGDLDVSGNADFTNASEFHLREVANEATAACTTLNELVLDTGENRVYTCTATGTPGTWAAVDSGSADTLDSVYSNDSDGIMDTTGGDFEVDTDDTTDGDVIFTLGTGLIDFNAGSFDLLTSGAISLDGGAASNFTTSSGLLTLDGAGGVTVEGNTSTITFNTSGTIDANFGTYDLDGAIFDLLASDYFAIAGTNDSTISTSTGDITLQAGDDLIFDDAQLTGVVQLTDADSDWAGVLPGNGIIDNINAFTSTTAGEGASLIGIEAGSLTSISGTDLQTVLEDIDTSMGQNGDILLFYPEYPDTVFWQDGGSNRGKLESGYDDTNDEHYYEWTTKQGSTQDIDLKFRFPLPMDFADVNNFNYKFRTGGTGNGNVEVYVYNATDETGGAPTLCGSDVTNSSAGAWTPGSILEATLETGCAPAGSYQLDPGDIIEVAIKLSSDNTASEYADIGVIELDYDN